ncbi:recombination protein NinG [Citrobacter braakii]|nr:recombination protein NinG [Citrobacter freundii]MCI1828455.1 recombination protein NinG [Citrobacter freundii]MDT7116676.1 recombination protein NinG [Citrobacter braakii]
MHKPTRRTCKICKEKFIATFENVWWCCPEHGAIYALELRTKEKVKAQAKRIREQHEAEKEGRQRRKARLAELRPTSYYKAQAQKAFNAFIRARDSELPCISCGQTNPPDLHGGQWDCGHFKTVGAHPELRFEEWNAHKQCKSCNAGSGQYSGKEATVAQHYEAGLIARYGQDYVDWLNGPHEMTNYRREDYIRIRDEYRAKLKAMKQEEAA